ncbi:MAG: septum formation initiator family protein [Treponema sp.]|nr:septum formation initiator family protein [Treponema sp.]
MIRCRFLIAACIGTFFYVVISFVGGRDGLWATRQMTEQKMILSANANEIQNTNIKLSLEKKALENDLEVVGAYAKGLGYIYEGEKLMKISGLKPHENQIYDAGTVLKHVDAEFIPEKTCKGVGLVIFFFTYFVLLLVDFSRGKISFGRRESGTERAPVYDVQ